MTKLTKEQQTERDEAIARLRRILKPGSIITTVVRHVARSGMQRSISTMVCGEEEVESLDYSIARAIGRAIDNKHGGIKCHGCRMDMGFQLVYTLGRTLWPNGTTKPHGKRNGQPDSDGGYALKQRWL